LASWLVAGLLPGVNREPLKKIAPDPEVLLRLLYRWRDEAIRAGKEITRIAVAYEQPQDRRQTPRSTHGGGGSPLVLRTCFCGSTATSSSSPSLVVPPETSLLAAPTTRFVVQ